ncbi:MAG: hypothetical protein IKS94_08385 [Prevotella sp.]|nr:hypothetical protein [Prevotella sp.]
MKKIVLLMTALLIVGLAFAQTPQENGFKGLLKSQQAITKSSVLTKSAKLKAAKKATFSPQKAEENYTPVTPPSDLETEEMPLEGLDLIDEEQLYSTVNVGKSGSDVYVQGLVPLIPEAWVKGTMEDGVVTFEPQFVGYIDDIEPCFLMSCDDEDNLLPFVMFYDAELNAYDAEGLMLLYPNTEELDYDFVQGLYLGIHIGDRPDVVTPPEELETTKMRFSGLNYDDEKVSGKVYVGFDGKDVYIQNLVSQVSDAWIKGTLNDDNTQVTFPCGQYVGVSEYEATPVYIVGSKDGKKLSDITFNYDASNNSFKLQSLFLINAKKDEIYFYDYFQPGLVIEEPSGYSATIVEAPEDLVTEPYLFVGTDTYEEEEVIKEVNVGFYGENEVYIQGLSDYVEDAWVKGELNDGVLTIPGWLLGEYDSMYGLLEIVLNPATFTCDKDNNTFTTDGFTSFSEEMNSNMDEYENVVLTKIVEKPAMPKQPEILEYIEAEYGNSVKMEIVAKDTDDQPLVSSKLGYQLFIDIEKEVSALTFTPDLYEFLDEEMTVVPYNFADYYDFYKNGNGRQVYLNQPDQETWNRIGVKCIYTAGGETKETEISWFEIKEYDPNGIINITSDTTEQPIYNLQGMRVNKMQQRGLYIQGGKKFIK